MAGESMSYPLKYGYSLVGRVATCGRGVDAKKFLGKLVFAFSPHSRWVVADADGGVMLVPEVKRVFLAGFFFQVFCRVFFCFVFLFCFFLFCFCLLVCLLILVVFEYRLGF